MLNERDLLADKMLYIGNPRIQSATTGHSVGKGTQKDCYKSFLATISKTLKL